MGIFDKLLKKNLTPEEQERRSQEEKEWADKYYRAGERFGERIGFREKVEAINDFGNKYPKTFFGIIFGLLFLSFALNFMFSSTIGVFKHEVENIETISNISLSGGQTGREMISEEARKVAGDMNAIKGQIEAIIAKDSLTHQDSLEVKNLLLKLKGLHDIIK